jgi:hypothetical protein
MRTRLLPIVVAIGALLAALVAPAATLAVDPPTPAFGGPLDGAQEVPAVVTAATGLGTAVISADNSTIWYVVEYSGLSGAVAAAHIHTGAAGVAGGVILPLVVTASPMVGTLTAADFTASGSITTFAQAVAAIAAGNTYFNTHTAANPGGEIRGQIGGLPAPAATPTPPTTSTAPESPAPPSTPPDLAVILTVLIAIAAWSALMLNLAGRRVRTRR